MSQHSHISALESLLFISGEPLTFARLEKTLNLSREEIQKTVEALQEKYRQDEGSGLMLIVNEREVLLGTKPENGALVESLTKSALQETMSKAALEVLAIVAYRAPITRAEIDTIRGVNCSFTLRNLLLRDLISREGNPDDNRGYVYRPTLRFLQALGIDSIEKLPDYETLSQDERLKMILDEDVEQDTKEISKENETQE